MFKSPKLGVTGKRVVYGFLSCSALLLSSCASTPRDPNVLLDFAGIEVRKLDKNTALTTGDHSNRSYEITCNCIDPNLTSSFHLDKKSGILFEVSSQYAGMTTSDGSRIEINDELDGKLDGYDQISKKVDGIRSHANKTCKRACNLLRLDTLSNSQS